MPFTIVFAGELSAIKTNPFKIESEFGLPLVVSVNDLTEEIEDLKQELERYMEIANRNEDIIHQT